MPDYVLIDLHRPSTWPLLVASCPLCPPMSYVLLFLHFPLPCYLAALLALLNGERELTILYIHTKYGCTSQEPHYSRATIQYAFMLSCRNLIIKIYGSVNCQYLRNVCRNALYSLDI